MVTENEVTLYNNIVKLIRKNHDTLNIETIIKELLTLGLKFPEITIDYIYNHYAIDYRNNIDINTKDIELN